MNAEQAWINGMQDYRKGLLRSECPYKLDGGFRDAWLLGWRMGLEDSGWIASTVKPSRGKNEHIENR